jgi:hypothetical protein
MYVNGYVKHREGVLRIHFVRYQMQVGGVENV